MKTLVILSSILFLTACAGMQTTSRSCGLGCSRPQSVPAHNQLVIWWAPSMRSGLDDRGKIDYTQVEIQGVN